MPENNSFSVQPELGSNQKEPKFYQTRLFQIVAGAFGGLVLLSVIVAIVIVASSGPSELNYKRNNLDIASLKDFDKNSVAKSSIVPAKADQDGQSPEGSKKSTFGGSVIILPSSVPAFIQGTALEGMFRVLRRNWKVASVAAALFFILAAVGIGLGIYFHQKQISDELAEQARLDELKRAEEAKAAEQENGLPTWLLALLITFGVNAFLGLLTAIFFLAVLDRDELSASMILPFLVAICLFQPILLSLFVLIFTIKYFLCKGLKARKQPWKAINSVFIVINHVFFIIFSILAAPSLIIIGSFNDDKLSFSLLGSALSSKWNKTESFWL